MGMMDRTTRSAGPESAHITLATPASAGGSDWRGRWRMSVQRKQGAVLRLLRGTDLQLVSREHGVMAAELSAWRDLFLAAGGAVLKTRPADGHSKAPSRLGYMPDQSTTPQPVG
jgi:hypothetical protein